MRSIRWYPLLMAASIAFPRLAAAQTPNAGAAVAVAASGERLSVLTVPEPDSGAICLVVDGHSGIADLRAQRVDRHGHALWGSVGVLVGASNFASIANAVIGDGAGGCIVAWTENRGATGQDVLVQRVMPDGTLGYASSGLVICNAARDQSYPQLLAGPAGSYYVIWNDDRPALGSETDYYAQRVSLAGVPQWAANGVVITPAATRPYGAPYPYMVTDAQSGFIVNWRTSTSTQRVQRVNSAGTLLYGASSALLNLTEDYSPTLAADGLGGVWALGTHYIGSDLYLNLQHVSFSGNNLITGNGVQGDVSYGGWTDWSGMHNAAGGLWLFASRSTQWSSRRQFSSAGVDLGTFDYLDYHPSSFSVTDLGTGYATAIVFEANGAPGRYQLRVQRYGYDGTALYAGGGRLPGRDEPSLLLAGPAVAAMGAGLMVSWTDGRYLAPLHVDRYNVFGQAYDAAGNALWDDAEPPTIVAAADAPNDQGGFARITWNAGLADSPGAVVSEYRVWRALPSAPAGAARLRPEAGGEFEMNGRRLLYRANLFWEMAAAQPAAGLSAYALSTPTGQDSIAGNSADMSFMVEAVDDSSHQWWSGVMVGHSLDNLAPGVISPATGFFAGGTTTLFWGGSSAPDLCCYEVFRGGTPSFTASDASRIGVTTDVTYSDVGAGPAFYRIAARDVHGNRGPSALVMPSGVLDVAGPEPPAAWSLRAAWQRAAGVLALTLEVPHADGGSVDLFDVAGRRLWSAPFRTDGAQRLTLRIPTAQLPLAPGLVLARARSVSGRTLNARTIVIR